MVQQLQPSRKPITITLNDVKQWVKCNIEATKQVNGINSFVAPYRYYDYQLDFMLLQT